MLQPEKHSDKLIGNTELQTLISKYDLNANALLQPQAQGGLELSRVSGDIQFTDDSQTDFEDPLAKAAADHKKQENV